LIINIAFIGNLYIVSNAISFSIIFENYFNKTIFMKTSAISLKKAFLLTLASMSIVLLSAQITSETTQQDTTQTEKPIPEDAVIAQTESLAADLELTPEQTEKVTDICTDFQSKVRAAKAANATDDTFKVLYRNLNDSIQQLLNKDQHRRWEEKAAKRQQEKKAREERIKAAKIHREKNKGKDEKGNSKR
jgi:hypothetical protein